MARLSIDMLDQLSAGRVRRMPPTLSSIRGSCVNSARSGSPGSSNGLPFI